MNKRLVWNFEINNDSPLDTLRETTEDADGLRWEARYFWDEDASIILYGLNDRYLNLGRYKIRERQDLYSLLPDSDWNVKQRRQEWLYKPLIKNTAGSKGFGKKINLTTDLSGKMLPGGCHMTSEELLERVHTVGSQVYVDKTALIYTFSTQPSIKLELARLTIKKSVWFSACIEGRSQMLVNLISRHLFRRDLSCDYVHFIKERQGLMPHD